MDKPVSLDLETLSRLGVGRVMNDNTKPVNSICFSANGDLVVTAGDDETIHLYNAITASQDRVLHSKKYGVSCIRFTHHQNAVLAASKNTNDHSVRYLSLHDNQYLRYFKGHHDQVVSIAMSPVEDIFLTSSLDKTLRKWDLRTPECIAKMNADAQCQRLCVEFDPLGLVFATCSSPNIVKLFDFRNCDKGPFDTMAIDTNNTNEIFTHIKFSPEGKRMLLTALSGNIYILDAFSAQRLQLISTPRKDTTTPFEASFSPDGRFIVAGCEPADLRIWDVMTGDHVCTLLGHGTVPACVQWNPTRCSLVTASTQVAFWCPSTDK